MKPEDWQQGMLSEAEHAPDSKWAMETRTAAWWAARRTEFVATLTWRTLALPLLLVALWPAMLVFLVGTSGVVFTGPSAMLSMIFFYLMSFLGDSSSTLLLLLAWIGSHIVRQGRATWTVALIASTVMPLIWAATALVAHLFDSPFNRSGPEHPLLRALLLVSFLALPAVFAWAVGVLKRAGDAHSK